MEGEFLPFRSIDLSASFHYATPELRVRSLLPIARITPPVFAEAGGGGVVSSWGSGLLGSKGRPSALASG